MQIMRKPSLAAGWARTSVLDWSLSREVDSRHKSFAKSMSSKSFSLVQVKSLSSFPVPYLFTSFNTIRNRIEDSERPCFTPAETGIGSDNWPLCEKDTYVKTFY